MARSLLLVLAWMTAFCLTSGARAQPTSPPPLPNGDFSKGEVGGLPTGWFVPTGLKASITDGAGGGGRRVTLKSTGTQMGNFMQSFDAKPYRGRDVLLKFKLSVTGAAAARAQPWIRVDRPNEATGWFDNSGDRPVTAADKETTTVLAGHVDDDAVSLNVGVMVFGGGTATLRSITLEEGRLPDSNVKPSPLTDQGLANLTAFALMYGQVKYFHPSDEAFRADWSRLAADGVRRVEACPDAPALAAALADAFAEVGVGIQVWAGDNAPAAPPPPAAETRITGWRHSGVSFGPEFSSGSASSAYKSQRIKEEVAEGDARKLPKPGTFATGSAAGVSWRIPVVLAVNERGATGAVTGTPRPITPRAEGFRPSGNDRVTRLADVIAAWNVFEHFYPYFDVTPDADWKATLTRSLKAAATDADQQAFLATLRRLVADLHDGHGNVFKADLRPQKGLPCGWRILTNGDLVVTSGGQGPDVLHAGDKVVSVDGRPVAELIEGQRALTSGATQQWRDWAAARNLLGHAPTADPSVVVIERAGVSQSLRVPLVAAEKLAVNDPKRPATGAVVGHVEGKDNGEIVYFNLDGAKADAIDNEIEHLHKAAGIVFDLRGYPNDAATIVLRHLTDEPLQSAKWIIPMVTMPGGEKGGGWEWQERGRWNLPPMQPRLGGASQPVVFVTDGRAISYAESVMGIVEAYKLGGAEIVGGPTAGTNGNINPFTLPGGYSIIWTGMRVIKHDGSRHHGVGIAPTVPCEPTPAGLAAGRDEVLDKAIEVIKAKTGK